MMGRSSSRFQQWGSWTGRIVLGAVFIYAAVLKLASPQEFANHVAAYQIVPNPGVNLLALGLPLFEFACGLLVLTGLFIRVGALGLGGLLAVFIAAAASAWLRGLSIDCGCFGARSWLDSNPPFILIRDGLLLGLCVFLYVFDARRLSLSKLRRAHSN
jgi:uncharacterized membrane protein YphA (DoxX/SURF4 family)